MAGNPYRSRPTQSWGYYRGVGSDGPLAQGQGSQQGQANFGVGMFTDGQGPAGQARAWEPTIPVLLALVVVEVIVFGCIGRVLERWSL